MMIIYLVTILRLLLTELTEFKYDRSKNIRNAIINCKTKLANFEKFILSLDNQEVIKYLNITNNESDKDKYLKHKNLLLFEFLISLEIPYEDKHINCLEKAIIVNHKRVKNIDKEEILELIKNNKINHYHLRDMYSKYHNILNNDCINKLVKGCYRFKNNNLFFQTFYILLHILLPHEVIELSN